jgi:pimeloyl-ACP methyl ester carboxylesterase
MPYVKVNDIHMYYEIHGDGELLVLIVGLGTDISEWEGIIHWLAQKYKVLAFDNRGAGRTDKPDTHYSIEMMANDTAELMQALGIKQAYILGISMGGRIALALALQHPKRVKKLVLVSTSARSIKNWRSRFFDMLSSMPFFRSKYPQPHYAFMRQRQASFVYSCAAKLHELHIPTVIMHGKKDKVVPYKLAEEMHTGIKGSKMLTFAGGHIFFFMKERQQFLDAIAEFVGT